MYIKWSSNKTIGEKFIVYDSYLNISLIINNWGDFSEEQGYIFYQDMGIMKELYQGR